MRDSYVANVEKRNVCDATWSSVNINRLNTYLIHTEREDLILQLIIARYITFCGGRNLSKKSSCFGMQPGSRRGYARDMCDCSCTNAHIQAPRWPASEEGLCDLSVASKVWEKYYEHFQLSFSEHLTGPSPCFRVLLEWNISLTWYASQTYLK